MRDVDEPALAADLGDRLRQRHPARDLLLDEQADDLALVGGLDLLADDHLDAVLGGLGARVVGAGDLVVVGHRDRARGRRRAPSPAARRPASRSRCEWSVCMCRSTSISLRLASRARTSGLRVRVVAQRRQPGVDRLDLVGHARPRELRRAVARRARRRPARSASSRDARRSSCCGEHVDVAGLEVQAEVAVAQHLLVDRHARRRAGTAPAPSARISTPGAVTWPSEAATTTSAPRERRVLVVDHVHAVAQARAQRRDGAGLASRRRPPTAAPPGSRRSARRKSRSAPRSSRSEKTIRSGPSARARGRSRGHARAQQLGRTRGSSAAAAPRWPRSWPCGRPGGRRTARRSVRATCVESTRSAGAWNEPTFSAREWRSATEPGARRPRLVHVHEVQRRDRQRLLDRARDVDRRRRVDALAAAGEQQLADAEHPHAAVGIEQRLRLLPRGPDQPAATPAPAPASATARATAPGARARPAPARPRRRTSRPRSHPRADAARPARWRSAPPLAGAYRRAMARRAPPPPAATTR